jgi:hypothetical protein
MEAKHWIWIGILASLLCAVFILLRKSSHEEKQEKQDNVELVFDTLMKLKESSMRQTGKLSGDAGKGYAGSTTDPETGKQVVLYDTDTVDKSNGMTYLQQSTNLIKGQDMILTIYRNIMGNVPILCFKLSPVITRIEMLGNATSGNGPIIPFVDKLNQNMKILNDMVAVLISRNDPDLFRQLGAIMAISLFLLTACTSPKQLSIQRNDDKSITATMNQTELTTGFLATKSIPPTTISYKRKDVYDIENDKGKVSMDAAQTYFLNLAKTKNLTTTGGTGDIAAAQQMGKDLQAITSKTIQIEDLGKILLLGTYYGPFGQVAKKPYSCES